MSRTSKITSDHLERLAMVYLRQSTPVQVRENTVSTARQYAQAEDAARLGWDNTKIRIIDADLGVSGRSGVVRTGFAEIVRRVCMGEVGAIFGLEISRLARSSADLQRLLEFCNITNTLVVDADGIYDLRDFNDRLLLGLKAQMSEAELHVLAGRLHESRRAAARRGAFRMLLSIGYVYDAERRPVLDPNEEVRQAVADVFSTFAAVGSAYGVVGAFMHRRFPKRGRGAYAGDLQWGRLNYSRALDLLTNPVYAGAYVYGRLRCRRTVDPDGTIRTKVTRLPRPEWGVIIHDHHPAYISWDTFLANQRRLAGNHTPGGARPPREGHALLQGIAFCGGCGHAMSVAYRRGKAVYDCSQVRQDHIKTPGCRTVLAETVDPLVAQRLLEAVTAERIALALDAADEVADRHARTTRALELQVERARYEAIRAERAFHNCEPEDRLVARSLERRWEEKLAAVAEAEATLAQVLAEVAPLPPRAKLEALATDLPRLWNASTTSHKDRKRLLRALIADVTLISDSAKETVRVGIHWRSGAADEVIAHRPTPPRTPVGAVELIRRLAHRSNRDVAAELNGAGFMTGAGRSFTTTAVQWIRRAYGIPAAPVSSAMHAPGELTLREVADRFGISAGTVYYWLVTGQLEGRRDSAGHWCITFSLKVDEYLRARIASSTRIKTRVQMTSAAGAV
jgi:DNA invertase Pin-like site-specific DNA recombinase